MLGREPTRTSQDLIKSALDGGGEENVSVIVVQVSKGNQSRINEARLLAKPEIVTIPRLPAL